MGTPVNLNLITGLPLMRLAIDFELLQAQTTKLGSGDTGCYYQGPCLIGCTLYPVDQSEADNDPTGHGTSVRALLNSEFFSCPPGQADDLVALQGLHDLAVNHAGDGLKGSYAKTMSQLSHFVDELMLKYGIVSEATGLAALLKSRGWTARHSASTAAQWVLTRSDEKLAGNDLLEVCQKARTYG